jgi:hypothetical protein
LCWNATTVRNCSYVRESCRAAYPLNPGGAQKIATPT